MSPSKYIVLIFLLLLCGTAFPQNSLGLFAGQKNTGALEQQVFATYDSSLQVYSILPVAPEERRDNNLRYLWRKLKGDFILRTRAVYDKSEENYKLGWMIRSNLAEDAPFICASVFSNGRSALHFRQEIGGEVEEEIPSQVHFADYIQLEKRGNRFIMSVARFGEPWRVSEVKELDLGGEIFVGLFVEGHNQEAVGFRNVRVIRPAGEEIVPYREYLGSNIEVLEVGTGYRQIVYSHPASLQAPNWTPDDKHLIYNSSDGLMYRFDLDRRKPELLNTDFVKANNNDHVISFDGTMLGLSSSSGAAAYGSLIYTVPIQGGKPLQITKTGPSYLHGWSPDGEWLTYTGLRNGVYDIYKIPAVGGKEVRLTTAPGLDDGSEYSPDGKYIYFNSVRTGKMELWRMKPNGKRQEQLTDDKYNNWFPHISPDGKWIVFLSYMEDVAPGDHPFYKHVYLRMMPTSGGEPKIVAYFYGGQGSINTPSWSPDSRKVAFVSNTGSIE